MATYTDTLRDDISSFLALVRFPSYSHRRLDPETVVMRIPFGSKPSRPNTGQLYPRNTP